MQIISESPSLANTLQELDISGNALTRLPRQLMSNSFKYLHRRIISKNPLMHIQFGSFIISEFHTIELDSNDIVSIEPGAFQGRKELLHLLKRHLYIIRFFLRRFTKLLHISEE